jgi:hypothetical protein
MEAILHSIVTDTQQRDASSVAQQLKAEFSLGTFWFD